MREEGNEISRIEINKKIVFFNAASSALILILNASVLIWLQQYLLRRISPEEFSLLPILISVMAITPLLSMIFTGGISRYVTIAYAKDDDDEITRICSTMFPILLLAGTIFLAGGWLAAWNIEKFLIIDTLYVSDAKLMLALLVFSAAFKIPLSIFGQGFYVRQKFYIDDAISFFCQLLRMAILFGLLFGVSTRVLWVTVALVISELTFYAIRTPISLRLLPAMRINWKIWDVGIAKTLINFGAWYLVLQISATIKLAMDPLILNRFATAVDVAVFHVAGIAPRLLTTLLGPLSRPFFPIIASFIANNEFTKLRNTYLRTIRYQAWPVTIIAVPAIVFSNEFIHLYLGGKYDQSGIVMMVLLLVTVLRTFNALGPAIALAAAETKGIALRFTLIRIINLILTVLFVVLLNKGAMGSAIATLLAVAFIETTFSWGFCRNIAHTPTSIWWREAVWPCISTMIPPAIFCLVVKMTVGIDTWTELLAFSAISSLLHLGSILLFGLRMQDRIDIGRLADHSPAKIQGVLGYLAKMGNPPEDRGIHK